MEEDRESLRKLMAALEIPVDRLKIAAGWCGEKATRLKPNGSPLRRTPWDDLLEREALVLGVRGKAACWASFKAMGATEPRLPAAELDRLLTRAASQLDELEQLRLGAAQTALSSSKTP